MNRLASKLPHQRIIPYKICNIAQIQRQARCGGILPRARLFTQKGKHGRREGILSLRCHAHLCSNWSIPGYALLVCACWDASLTHLWQCGIFFSNRFVFVFNFTFSPELIEIKL